MSVLFNILWLLLGGIVAVVIYYVGGIVLMATVVGIPFGIQALNLGSAVAAPFGKRVERRREREGCLAVAFDIIWLVLFGWEIAGAHLAAGTALCLTIVGIPFGVQVFKLIPVALFPFTFTLR
ncbi:MAG: YccF domain-containing protein, partial [Anaerolineales bacterium]|nr:YccF domain-containing protein [Anaerolineales bacterium]